MQKHIDENQRNELKDFFSDLINYSSENPDEPIDPLNYVDSNGDNCLHIATQRNNFKIVKVLLDAGINVNSLGDMNCTPLHYASRVNNQKIINLLLEYGASNEIKNDFGQVAIKKD